MGNDKSPLAVPQLLYAVLVEYADEGARDVPRLLLQSLGGGMRGRGLA